MNVPKDAPRPDNGTDQPASQTTDDDFRAAEMPLFSVMSMVVGFVGATVSGMLDVTPVIRTVLLSASVCLFLAGLILVLLFISRLPIKHDENDKDG